jgi:hypothetical protein
MQTEEEFIIHSQQHSSTSQGASSRQVSPQSTTGAGASNSAGHVTTMPCIVCRQTLVSFLELRLHARHHFQSQQQVLPTPPPQGLSVPPSTAGLRSRYVCCVCLGQFDSADSVISRAGGYFVCVACSCRDNGLVIFDAGQSAVRTGTGATDPLSLPPLPRTYQCIKCQESFSSELDVRVHVTCHMINEGNIHECRLCECDSPVTFDSPARLQSHIIAEHEFGTDPSSSTTAAASGDSATSGTGVIRPCTVCGVTLVGPSAARVHALDHGPSTWPHVCQQCPLRFFFAAELKNHQLVTGHHQAASGGARSPTTTVASSPGPTDDLRCPECSRMFSGYASLCSHRRVHEKPVAMTTAVTGVELLMQDCAARCSSLDGLYSTGHVTENGVDGLTMSTGRDKMPLSGAAQVKGPSTPLQCPECSRQFPSLSSLQGHMRVHNSGMT